MPTGGAVTVEPIAAADVPAVAEFLHRHLNSRVSPTAWSAAMRPSWGDRGPNQGFVLREDGRIVGAHLAFYSERTIGGVVERFCNLGAWCVLDTHRQHALRLLRELLRQPGYTFTDLSPSGNVVGINERLRFRALDTTTALVPNLPWPTLPGRTRVSSDPEELVSVLDPGERRIYDDHRTAPAAHHVLVRRHDDHCYLILRRDRRKRLPVFGSVLYASNPPLLREGWRAVSRHLLLRHRMLATLAELRVVGERPPAAVVLSRSRPRMFRSERLGPDGVDYLYSELTGVAW